MLAWFIIGILGVLALTVVLMIVNASLQLFLTLLKRPCPSCATLITPAATVCPHCQQPVLRQPADE